MASRFLADAVVGTLMARDRFENCTRDADGFVIDTDECYVPFWFTRTGTIVKWSLFLGLGALLGLYLLIGHIHGKKRLRRGLPPLAYHRWLVPRSELARVDPRYAYPQAAGYTNYNPDAYAMGDMPPPPVYDPRAARPPMYTAPDGSSKVDPSQRTAEPTYRPSEQQAEPYEAPLGPPPSSLRPQGTGNTNPFRG